MAIHVWEFAFTHRKIGIAAAVFACLLLALGSTGLSNTLPQTETNHDTQAQLESATNTEQSSQNGAGVLSQPMVFTDANSSDSDPGQTTNSNVDIRLNITTESQGESGTDDNQSPQQSGELTVNDVVIPVQPNKTTTKTIIDDDSRVRVRVRGRSNDTSSNNSISITVDGNN